MDFAPTNWMAFDMAFMHAIKPQVDFDFNLWFNSSIAAHNEPQASNHRITSRQGRERPSNTVQTLAAVGTKATPN